MKIGILTLNRIEFYRKMQKMKKSIKCDNYCKIMNLKNIQNKMSSAKRIVLKEKQKY